jgi:putative AdoMet-dependent methyltransferase
MLRQARAKMRAWAGRFQALLAADPFLSLPFRPGTFDVVASAFAVHHLDEPAKAAAARELHRALRPGGVIVLADTMFRDAPHKAEALRTHPDLEDEYQPLLTHLPRLLEEAGFRVALHQVGELVWVLTGRRG